MKKLAFLFVFVALVACNTQEVETEGLKEEVESIEVTDSTLILTVEPTDPEPTEPVAE